MYSILLQAQAQQGEWWHTPALMIAIIAVMYFFMIRPQQKQRKEIEQKRKALQKGYPVVTAGGIHGKIKEVNETYFVIEIAEGVCIKVDRASVFATSDGVK